MEPRHTVTSILRPVYHPREKSPVTRLHSFFWKLFFFLRGSASVRLSREARVPHLFSSLLPTFCLISRAFFNTGCFPSFFWCTTLLMRPLFRVLTLRFLHSLQESRCVFFCSYIRPGSISNAVNSRLVDPANTKNFQSQQNLQTDVAVIINFSHYELTDTVSVLSNLNWITDHGTSNIEH